MSIFINYPKERCARCNIKFYPKFCQVCKDRDFYTCKSCHEHSPKHKRELSKLHA